MKLAILAAIAVAAGGAPVPRDLAAVPIGEPTYLEGKGGYWEAAGNCTVAPTPQCKYTSWTLCSLNTTEGGTSYWCAFEVECKTEEVGCKGVDGFVEMKCEEADNKCGDSFCGTAPAQFDCQCDAEEKCVAVKFVETPSGASIVVSSILAAGVVALAGFNMLV